MWIAFMDKQKLTICVNVSSLILFQRDPLLSEQTREEQWLLKMDMRIISRTVAVVMCTTIINFKGNEVYASFGSRTGTLTFKITQKVAFLVTVLL